MSFLVRPLTPEDHDPLVPLDEGYCAGVGCELLVAPSSLSYYARSGHAFVLEDEGAISGFLLGQAVWDGRRPTVAVRRLVAGDDAGRRALLEAVTKSAYDAGVYDLVVEQPDADLAAPAALEASGYRPRPLTLYGRVLGSRSRSG